MQFEEVLSADYYNKEIQIKCMVIGKSLSSYNIPKVVRITDRESHEYIDYTVNYGNENVLRFIDRPVDIYGAIYKSIFGLVGKFDYEVISTQSIERIFIVPPSGKERNRVKTSFTSYYLGNGLDVNCMYEMKGYATVDPKDQTVTQVFLSAEKVHTDIDNFNLTKGIRERLKVFNVGYKDTQDIFEYLNELYISYACNITKIYERFDLHLVIDMAIRSVMSFNFDNELIKKGWTDVMVIGDTRCGKGYVAEGLTEYYNVGEVVSGENASYAGLVGGLQQFGSKWTVTWGKIPLNDCGLVVLDETSALSEDIWSRLSSIRGSGIAEINKIMSQRTQARTRLISLCNPIKGAVSNYSYGIQALTEMIKSPEDIARFDYVLVVANSDVTGEDINKSHHSVDVMYDQNCEQELILWTWSRKEDQIVFSKSAIDKVYYYSSLLSKVYSDTISLIKKENIRIKLCKIAIAFASRLYSNIDNGDKLFVDEQHVDCANIFLNLIYKKQTCGYYQYSAMCKPTHENMDFSKVEKYISAFKNQHEELCICLLQNNQLTVKDISEHVNLPLEIAREIISTLLKNNCIIKKYQYYIKTTAFITWLKKKVLKD